MQKNLPAQAKVRGLKRYLWLGIKSSFVALHYWKGASRDISFLQYPHRHIFNVTLQLQIHADRLDRHLEFFIVQKELKDFLSQWEDRTLPMSCEMFAKRICSWAMVRYRLLGCSVTVQEDEENFATYSEVTEF